MQNKLPDESERCHPNGGLTLTAETLRFTSSVSVSSGCIAYSFSPCWQSSQSPVHGRSGRCGIADFRRKADTFYNRRIQLQYCGGINVSASRIVGELNCGSSSFVWVGGPGCDAEDRPHQYSELVDIIIQLLVLLAKFFKNLLPGISAVQCSC